MSQHDLPLVSLGVWLALAALAGANLAVELRWRRWCVRRDCLNKAAQTAVCAATQGTLPSRNPIDLAPAERTS